MATFAELKTEVLTLVIDVPTAVQQLVDRFVNRAIRKLQQKHNFKIMERTLDTYTTLNTRALAQLPTNWKEQRGKPYLPWSEDINTSSFSYLTWAGEAAEVYARYNTQTGTPRVLVHDGQSDQINIYPMSDGRGNYCPDTSSNCVSTGEYKVVIPYWGYLDTLAADGDENWFTKNAEQWIVYQATAEAFYANEDEGRAQLWEKRASREYADILLLDKDRSMVETDVFAYHTGVIPPHLQE